MSRPVIHSYGKAAAKEGSGPALLRIGAVPGTFLYALVGASLVLWETNLLTLVVTLFLVLIGYAVQLALCHTVLYPKWTLPVTLVALCLPALVWGVALLASKAG